MRGKRVLRRIYVIRVARIHVEFMSRWLRTTLESASFSRLGTARTAFSLLVLSPALMSAAREPLHRQRDSSCLLSRATSGHAITSIRRRVSSTSTSTEPQYNNNGAILLTRTAPLPRPRSSPTTIVGHVTSVIMRLMRLQLQLHAPSRSIAIERDVVCIYIL